MKVEYNVDGFSTAYSHASRSSKLAEFFYSDKQNMLISYDSNEEATKYYRAFYNYADIHNWLPEKISIKKRGSKVFVKKLEE